MKVKLLSIAIMLLIEPSMALTQGKYQRLCGQPSKLSRQGKNICKKHARRVHRYRSFSTAKQHSESKPVRVKTYVEQPVSQFKDTRIKNRTKIKPYTPGAYRRPEKKND